MNKLLLADIPISVKNAELEMKMKERPILFNSQMVQAILDNRKTQTRRVVRDLVSTSDHGHPHSPMIGHHGIWYLPREYSPYGIPGDRLWVRETFTRFEGEVVYRADTSAEGEMVRKQYGVKWKPAIYMPRALSRIMLEIVNVRVERVQDISERDCEIELGVAPFSLHDGAYPHFHELWNTINAKRGFGWDENPYVWVIEFKKL